MRNNILKAIGIILIISSSVRLGMIYEQYRIGERIWHHEKDCYNEQDLKIIVYGSLK